MDSQKDEKGIKCTNCDQQMELPNSPKTPKILPCLHTFCGQCLTTILSQTNTNIECPRCRYIHNITSVDKLPNNYEKIKMIELLPVHSTPLFCQFCEEDKPSQYKCLDCSVLLCQTHQSAHEKRAKAHKIVSLDDPQFESQLTQSSSIKCEKSNHSDEELKFYCETCEKLICRECALVDHPKPNHQYAYIEQSALNCKVPIEESLQSVHSELPLVASTINKINETLNNLQTEYEKVKNDIKKETKELISSIEKRETRLISELEDIKNRKSNLLNKQLAEFQNIENVCEFTKSILDGIPVNKENPNNKSNNTSELQILLLKNEISQKLKELSELKKDNICETSEIEFLSYSIENFTNINYNNTNLSNLIENSGCITEPLFIQNNSIFIDNETIKEVNETPVNQEVNILIKYFNKKGERIISNKRSSQILPTVDLYETSTKQKINTIIEPVCDKNDSGQNVRILFTPNKIENLTLNIKQETVHFIGSPFQINVAEAIEFDPLFCGTNMVLSNSNFIATTKKGNSGVFAKKANPTSFKIKILNSSGCSSKSIGLAIKQKFDINSNNDFGKRSGWFLNFNTGSLYSKDGDSNRTYHGSALKVGDIIEVKYNKENKTISFVINETDRRIAFQNINTENSDIFPAFIACCADISVEFI